MFFVNNLNINLTRGDDAFIGLEIKQREFPYDNYELNEDDKCILTVRKFYEDNEYEENPILFEVFLVDNYFHIKPEHTNNLDFGEYFYDVQLFSSNNLTMTVIGLHSFNILPEVSY